MRGVPGYTPGSEMAWMVVQIEEIDWEANKATCVDELGGRREVNPHFRRAKGALPSVGEMWVIDCFLGEWAFAACMAAVVPQVSGSTDDIPALKNLIAVLHDAGIVFNDTTNNRIRAGHQHTHSTPAGASGPPIEPA